MKRLKRRGCEPEIIADLARARVAARAFTVGFFLNEYENFRDRELKRAQRLQGVVEAAVDSSFRPCRSMPVETSDDTNTSRSDRYPQVSEG